jgi:hypothetical protein
MRGNASAAENVKNCHQNVRIYINYTKFPGQKEGILETATDSPV